VTSRNVPRLALAVGLVAVVGVAHGVDTAMVVALCLVVMEADAHRS
jgi:hypothetical protein